MALLYLLLVLVLFCWPPEINYEILQRQRQRRRDVLADMTVLGLLRRSASKAEFVAGQ